MKSDDYDLGPVALADLDPAADNVRTRRDPDEDRRLVDSVTRLGVLQPVGVMPAATAGPPYLVVWGHRRVWAAAQAKLKTIPAVRMKRRLSETDFRLHQFAENDLRSPLTDPEVFAAVADVRRLNPGCTNADLAKWFSKDPSMMTRIVAVDRLIPAARSAFDAGAFGFSIAYEIAKGGSDQDQHQLLAERLGGSSRAALARTPRAARPAAADPVKAGRLRIALGGGLTVTVAGADLTLAAAATALERAGKEAERAKAQGLNIRTAERVWKDRASAKAGTAGG